MTAAIIEISIREHHLADQLLVSAHLQLHILECLLIGIVAKEHYFVDEGNSQDIQFANRVELETRNLTQLSAPYLLVKSHN